MALTHVTAVRNAATNAVVDLIDGGVGAGYMRILTSGDAALVDIDLHTTAFGDSGASVAGRADAASLPKTGTAGAAGTAAKFIVYNGSDVEIFRGTVSAGGGGGDAIIDNTSIASAQEVTLTAFTYMALPQ